jgi:putative glutamine amidotransferase
MVLLKKSSFYFEPQRRGDAEKPNLLEYFFASLRLRGERKPCRPAEAIRIVDFSQLSFIFSIALSFLVLSGCSFSKPKPLCIAVSKASLYYVKWLKKGDSSLVIKNLYILPLDSAVKELRQCSGLLLTGGEDIQPDLYGKGNEIDFCDETDPRRDTLELTLTRTALQLKMPVLGICRGEQILNITLGGILIIDIPGYKLQASGDRLQASSFRRQASSYRPQASVSGIPVILHQTEDYLHTFHPVTILHNTTLYSIVRCDTGTVVSNHHQAVEIPAPDLQINAQAPDGIIEGVEWKMPQDKSFLIGVQWHPERMDTANALSGRLLKQFIYQSRIYEKRKTNRY